MILTDTHTHLYNKDFEKDISTVLDRAREEGISRFFVPAIDSGHTQAMYDLERNFPSEIFLMMGLHPTSVNENFQQELAKVKTELDSRKFYAVGEIGIDLYWDKTFLKLQQQAFQYQIQLAKKHRLPIVIHCRNAFEEIFETLEKEKDDDLCGIFHCFTGDLEQAKQAISYNMKLGIGGVITFKNGKIDQFLDDIPLDNIVLETDSPYLAPTPHRGKRNESSYIKIIAEKIAEIYNVSLEEVAAITTKNSKDVFGI